VISKLFKLSYFWTISYLDIWEKINNLFIDENHTSQLFILVKVSMETRNESRDCVNITQTGTHFE
jgi:hypothetical protein